MNRQFTFEEYKKIYSQVPRLTVEVVIQDKKGILFTLRDIPPFANVWHLPGGTVYFKESLEGAVKRIAKEELGVDVTLKKFLGYIEYLHQEAGGGFDYPVGLAFLCNPTSKKFILDEQASTIKFFSDFPQNIVGEQKEFLQNMKKNNTF